MFSNNDFIKFVFIYVQLNSREANYRVSTSKKEEATTKYFKQKKNWRVYVAITIIMIPIE
jgi:hypothetical protein